MDICSRTKLVQMINNKIIQLPISHDKLFLNEGSK